LIERNCAISAPLTLMYRGSANDCRKSSLPWVMIAGSVLRREVAPWIASPDTIAA
jgi:hypothetical protein